MNMKIEFLHPMRNEILIFIGGDMPHLIKKVCQCFRKKWRSRFYYNTIVTTVL